MRNKQVCLQISHLKKKGQCFLFLVHHLHQAASLYIDSKYADINHT